MVDAEILFSNMKSPSQVYSDFPTDQTFHNFMTLIQSLTFTELRVVSMEHLQWCGMSAGNAHPSGHLAPSPFWGLAYMLQLLRPVFPNLPCLFLTFHLEYSSVSTFSILRRELSNPIGALSYSIALTFQ